MGLWDFLTGTKTADQSGTSLESGSKHEVQVKGTGSTSQTGTIGAERGSQSQISSTLPPEVQQLILDAMRRVPTSGSAISTPTNEANAELLGFARDIVGRAKAGTSVIEEAVGAQRARATQDFDRDTMMDINRQAQQIGSKDNSTFELMRMRGQEDLQTRLAEISTKGALEGRQLMTTELDSAFQDLMKATETSGGLDISGAQTGTGQLAALVEALKGGQTETNIATDTRTEQQSTTNQLEQILQELLAEAETSTKTKSKGSEGSTIFDMINSLGAFVNG